MNVIPQTNANSVYVISQFADNWRTLNMTFVACGFRNEIYQRMGKHDIPNYVFILKSVHVASKSTSHLQHIPSSLSLCLSVCPHISVGVCEI